MNGSFFFCSRLCLILGLLVMVASMSVVRADVPQKINYQGRLTDSITGQPLPGSHNMTFRIFNQESGGSALWTETQAVSADTAGVVSVMLGNINPISISFDGEMWLEVEVDGEVLSPRRQLVSVPYSFLAAQSDHAADADMVDGLNADAFADSGHFHDDRYYTESELSDVGMINDAGNPVDWTKLKNVPAGFADGTDDTGPGDGHSLDAVDGDPTDVVYVDAEGEVGIGTTSPAKKLDVAGSIRLNHNNSISFGDDNTRIYHTGNDLYARTSDDLYLRPDDLLYIGNAGGDNFAFNTQQKRLGLGTTNPLATLDVRGKARIAAEGGSPLTLSTPGSGYLEFDVSGAGPMGIRLTNSYRAMYLTHGFGAQDKFSIYDDDNNKEILTIAGPRANIGIWESDPREDVLLHLNAQGLPYGIYAEEGSTYTIYGRMDEDRWGVAVMGTKTGNDGYGVMGFAADNARAAVYAEATTDAAYALLAAGGETTGYFLGDVLIEETSGTGHRAFDVEHEPHTTEPYQTANFGLTSSPPNSHDIVQIRSPGASPDGFQFIECQRGSDIEFKVDGNGDVYADGTWHTPAMDFAEMVTVSSGAMTVEPGDVMIVDPLSTRSIKRSSDPRSPLVAGIYSTRPGFVAADREWDRPVALGAEEGASYTVHDMAAEFNEIPLAVVGIVPCKVSAENGSISPGDLLVTSSTPGHAMRDDDPKVGTVLGKALESLDSGTGLIKVLVTLQ